MRHKASDWDGKTYGYGAGRSNPCVKIRCPYCEAKPGELCAASRGVGVVFDTHTDRRVHYRNQMGKPERVRGCLLMGSQPQRRETRNMVVTEQCATGQIYVRDVKAFELLGIRRLKHSAVPGTLSAVGEWSYDLEYQHMRTEGLVLQ